MRLLLFSLLAQAPAAPPAKPAPPPPAAAQSPKPRSAPAPVASIDESKLTPPPLVEAPLDEVPGEGGDGMDRNAPRVHPMPLLQGPPPSGAKQAEAPATAPAPAAKPAETAAAAVPVPEAKPAGTATPAAATPAPSEKPTETVAAPAAPPAPAAKPAETAAAAPSAPPEKPAETAAAPEVTPAPAAPSAPTGKAAETAAAPAAKPAEAAAAAAASPVPAEKPAETAASAPAAPSPAEKPAVTAAAPPAPAPAVAPQNYPGFVKGELSQFLGADRVVTRNNRIGISLGVDRIGDTWFALVEPQLDLRFLDNRLAVGLGVPLRLELFTLGGSSFIQAGNLGRIRREDYDQPGEYARVLKYLTFGTKEDNLYINVGQRYASSIGHGTLVRRYAPNIDVNRTHVSAQLDAYNDYAGIELLTNDVVDWNLLSGLAFVKPLSFVSDNAVARSLSVGMSVAMDRTAPQELTTDPATGVRQVDSSGHLLSSNRPVTLVGVDAEVKVLKTRHADIKPYVDFSYLTGGDGGFTAGVLGRFNLGEKTVHAFRLIAEGRALGAKYVPSYFNTFYEVERYMAHQVIPSQWAASNTYQTKQQYVLSGALGNRLGYYLEASYGVRRNIGVTVALEGTNSSPEKNLVAHLEVPALDWLSFFGSYYKRGFSDFSEVIQVDGKSIFFAGARLRALPFLFINGRAYKSFQANPELQRYDNTFGFALDLELGWEFKPSEKPAESPTDSEGHAERGRQMSLGTGKAAPAL